MAAHDLDFELFDVTVTVGHPCKMKTAFSRRGKEPIALAHSLSMGNCLLVLSHSVLRLHARRGPPSYKVVITPTNPI